MNGFFEPVLGQLVAGLSATECERNLIRRFTASLKLVKEAIAGLKCALHPNPFAGKEEEIVYFRDQAPLIYGRLFYFMKLFLIESHRAHMSREKFRALLQEQMEKVEEFYERHKGLLQYITLEESIWEGRLYTRQGYGDWWAEEDGFYIDEDFTIGCYWMSKTRANQELMRWLSAELDALDRPALTAGGDEGPKTGLVWTGKLVDLVELVYGLHLVGCFNNGKGTLKDTMEAFEGLFGVTLGQYHITFQEIARRKITQTKFLDKMLEALKGKLDGML
jgi:hypothetical protein